VKRGLILAAAMALIWSFHDQAQKSPNSPPEAEPGP
jgi:hypothetical protein